MESKISDTLTLGQMIKKMRSDLNLTQIQTAGLCDVGVRFLSDVENGKPTVEFEKVLKVLKGLGLELFVKQKSWQ